MTLEIDWKQNGNKRLQSFFFGKRLETFSLTNQTVKKNWKLFHLQTKQWKKIGNFFTYKPNSQKKLETFSLTSQTMEKDWKLFHLQTKQWKTIGNNGKPMEKITNLGNCGQIVLMGIRATFVARHSSESCNGGQL